MFDSMLILFINYIYNCAFGDTIVQFSSTRLLEQCKTTETGDNVLKNVEKKVLDIIRKYKTQITSVDEFKFSFRIFENLFKHAEITFIGLIEIEEEEAIYSNDTASRLAAQPCQLIAEERSLRVPQWSTEDVLKWLTLIGFGDFSNNLLQFLIDGDLLLQLTEDNLENDIGIHNGISKKRIMRELYYLKQSADYSSIDTTDLNSFLKSISLEYSVYTYPMLIAGVNRDSMRSLTDDQLKNDCGILNGIHRSCIIAAIRELPVCVEKVDRPHDICISYRQSIGSRLASLLAVYLKIRGYKVFIDGIRSDDANSRQSVLQTIKQSKNFIIVLTPGSLDKHLTDSFDGDVETLDLISEEVAAAELGQRNIIPVLGDHFSWPPPALLPDDLKNLSNYNSISWVHEYQDACVNKLVTFLDQ